MRLALFDSLRNLVSGLGMTRGKTTGDTFGFETVLPAEAEAMYRGDWLARKIIDIIPADMTREWRVWQGEQDEQDRLYAVETALGVRAKVAAALRWARLYGGAAILIGDGASDPRMPLDVSRIGRDGIRYLTVFDRTELSAGEIDRDIASPSYGMARSFVVSGDRASVEIHRSRFILFDGADLPRAAREANGGWGASIFDAVKAAVTKAASAALNSAELIHEAKVDVVTVPDLAAHLADRESANRLTERFMLANSLKSTVGMLLLGGGEEFQRNAASFAGLTDLMHAFLQQAAGAADIPVTRLLGQSPAGMSSTGESDLRNYYDHIRSRQTNELATVLAPLNEALIRHALGSRPPSIACAWASLWQMTPQEAAGVAKTKAETTAVYVNTGLFPAEVLAKAATDQLVDDGVFPSLETHLAAFEAASGEIDFGGQTGRAPVGDARPRTLYVSRPVTNAADIIAWAKGQGFETTLTADDLHVTIAYSRRPVDWIAVGEAADKIEIPPGGPRIVEPLGDKGAVVLLFSSWELGWRHGQIREAGASWDWPEYQPHITLSYRAGDLDLETVEPYRGRIILGPERFEELDEDWSSGITEDAEGGGRNTGSPFADAYSSRQPRAPKGSAIGGQWISSGSGAPVVLSGRLTSVEKIELKNYKEDGYKDLNAHLRDPKATRPSLTAEYERQARTIDQALSKSRLTDDVTVYRGIAHPGLAKHADRLIGSRIAVSSFQSTSMSEGIAHEFVAFKPGAVVFRLKAQRGMNALAMDQFEVAANAGEQELLFGRGIGIKVSGVSRSSGITYIEGEFVP